MSGWVGGWVGERAMTMFDKKTEVRKIAIYKMED